MSIVIACAAVGICGNELSSAIQALMLSSNLSFGIEGEADTGRGKPRRAAVRKKTCNGSGTKTRS